MDKKTSDQCEGYVQLAAEVAELKKQLALIQDCFGSDGNGISDLGPDGSETPNSHRRVDRKVLRFKAKNPGVG